MDAIDSIDRTIINGLRGGFPISSRPFREAGAALGIGENELIDGVQRLVDGGKLSRFGPLWNAEGIGGDVSLAAMAVPPERFETIVAQVNAHPEVAHNYERTHALNMWFVVSADQPERISAVIGEIEAETGLPVYRMPKMREFFIGFQVEM